MDWWGVRGRPGDHRERPRRRRCTPHWWTQRTARSRPEGMESGSRCHLDAEFSSQSAIQGTVWGPRGLHSACRSGTPRGTRGKSMSENATPSKRSAAEGRLLVVDPPTPSSQQPSSPSLSRWRDLGPDRQRRGDVTEGPRPPRAPRALAPTPSRRPTSARLPPIRTPPDARTSSPMTAPSLPSTSCRRTPPAPHHGTDRGRRREHPEPTDSPTPTETTPPPVDNRPSALTDRLPSPAPPPAWGRTDDGIARYISYRRLHHQRHHLPHHGL